MNEQGVMINLVLGLESHHSNPNPQGTSTTTSKTSDFAVPMISNKIKQIDMATG